ncbi:MAG TPA: DMT family transporter [Pyrinomonadaceae bacterium]|nr:DMT family transporter [Pyrinomonadaceae bacterium]
MTNKSSPRGYAPHVALLAVQVMFATWPVVGKIALRTIPSLSLVAFRIAGAALAFLALGAITGRLGRIERRDWLLLIASSLLGVVLNQWLFVKGLSLTTVINATLLGTTIPVFTLLVSILLRKDRASARRMLGIAVAAAGVVYLIGPQRADFSQSSRLGDLLIVTNSLCYGTYIAISKDLVNRYSALTVITWVFVAGCVPAVPVGLQSLSHVELSTVSLGVWLAVLYIILVPTVGAYYLNSWALARVPPSTVAVYIYLQPLIAFALAPLLLGEKLGGRVIVASILVFAGVLIVTRRARSRAIKEVSEHPEAFGH